MALHSSYSLDVLEVIAALAIHLVSRSFFKVHFNPVIMSSTDHDDICPVPGNNYVNVKSLSSSEIVHFTKLDCTIILQDQLELLHDGKEYHCRGKDYINRLFKRLERSLCVAMD